MKLVKVIIFILAVSMVVPSSYVEGAGSGRITGKLMIRDGGSMAGGSVMLFNERSGPPPSPDKYWRVPDIIVKIAEDASFSLELPEGNYFMGAIKRLNDEKAGPPKEGDYLFSSRDENGKQKLHHIISGKTIDLGVISKAELFKRSRSKDITAIEGVIRDSGGNSMDGAIVFAYVSVNQIGIPLFVSERTGKDGKYRLAVAEGGVYYIRVRDVYGGGPPISGSIIGRYGEKSPVAVEVSTRTIKKNINISVMRVPEMGHGTMPYEKR